MRNELKSTLDQVGYAFLLDGLAYAACSLPAGVVCGVTSKNFHNLITKVPIIIAYRLLIRLNIHGLYLLLERFCVHLAICLLHQYH